MFLKIADKRFILAFDDAYYNKKSVNYSYVNMLRKKLKLKTIQEPKSNFSNKYFYEIENYLKQKKIKFKKIKTSYKKTYKKDIFFKYFMQDRKFMNKMGMEEKNQLKNRLEVFLIQQ